MTTTNITLFKPHKGQRQVIDMFATSNHRFGCVVTGRQYGKSLLGQNLLLYWLLANNKSKGAWISPIYKQARKVFEEIVAASHSLIQHSNRSELTVTFHNGSTINFLSAERGDGIRGFSFHYMVIDECAFVKDDVFEQAILPTLSALGKKCLMISTPKGKNWFYSYYLRGSNEGGDIISFRGYSQDNPYISRDFIEQCRLSMPKDIFEQEFEAKFTDASNDVFTGLEKISVINEYRTPNSSTRYYLGADIGLTNDYTAITIVNGTGEVCYTDRFNGITIEETAKRILDVGRRYSITGGYIETNNIGKAVFELVKKQLNRIAPFTTTQDSKGEAIRTLIHDIETGNILLPSKQLCPELHHELEMYTYKVSANGKLSFSHPAGHHDDLVDSLWLANFARHRLFSKNKINVGVI